VAALTEVEQRSSAEPSIDLGRMMGGPTHDVVGRHTSGLATTGHPPEWLNQPRWLNKAYSPSVRFENSVGLRKGC
jgi:hypothetical protein